ncbi:30S ribosomal protein S6e [Candidatus Woesearchaeota archaeon]|nr:30S ribosomal protein S6e [Candidatus Woesearchaeota archaeon]
MAEFKLVIANPSTGNCFQKDIKDEAAKPFLGLKVGDTVKGEVIDMTGYEFVITGGSDYCGFPMRKDVPGMGRKKILLVKGIGHQKTLPGMKKRKTVCGNTVHEKTAQINLKVTKQGSAPLAEVDVRKEKQPRAVRRAAKKKQATPSEAKPAEVPKAE